MLFVVVIDEIDDVRVEVGYIVRFVKLFCVRWVNEVDGIVFVWVNDWEVIGFGFLDSLVEGFEFVC